MRQSGNVLFLILIAVVLFAALSYAVTQSSRGGGNADAEKATLTASNLIQYGTQLTTAIMRMKINGVDETELCFYTGSNHATYNHAACALDANNVFHVDGGGVAYQAPPAGVNDGSDWEFTSRPRIWGLGTTDGSSKDSELIVALRDVTDSICMAINEKQGITGIPVDGGDLTVEYFDGDYVTGDNIDGCPANCADIASSPFGSIAANFGCFEEADTGENVFFYALLER